MFEELSAMQIWLLIATAAAAGFYAGRLSASGPPEAHARYKRIAQEEAARDFARLSTADQETVDRLAAAGKIVDAVKLVRAALHNSLYEAKQIVDQRRRSA